jgi:hypothetical protein
MEFADSDTVIDCNEDEKTADFSCMNHGASGSMIIDGSYNVIGIY